MKVRLLGAVSILALVLTFSRAESGGQEYIVVLKGGHSINALNKAHDTKTLRHVANTPIYLIKADINDVNDKLLKKLKKDDGVESAEKNVRVKLQSKDEVRLSSILVEQMAELLDGRTLATFYGTSVLKSYIDQPALTVAHVNEARSLSTGAGTHVAYIDTGVDFYHPALRPWLDPGVDLVFGLTASELVSKAPSRPRHLQPPYRLQPMVIRDHHGDLQPLLHSGDEFARAHQERRVADKGVDLAFELRHANP